MSLGKSPLVHVLAQVRFAPVLKMSDYVPDIQEAFRLEGFPLFNREQSQTAAFSPSGPEWSASTRWLFGSKDGARAVALGDGFVTLEFSRYQDFDEFVEVFEGVLRVVDRHVPGELIAQRVGLRYVDLIRNSEDLSAALQLDEGLRGLRKEQLDTLPHRLGGLMYAFETRGESPHGTLVVKLHQANDGSYLPPDLHQTALSPVPGLGLDVGEVVTILDFDHYSATQMTLDAGSVVDLLWKLHDYTDLAFRMAVTQEALELWGADG